MMEILLRFKTFLFLVSFTSAMLIMFLIVSSCSAIKQDMMINHSLQTHETVFCNDFASGDFLLFFFFRFRIMLRPLPRFLVNIFFNKSSFFQFNIAMSGLVLTRGILIRLDSQILLWSLGWVDLQGFRYF